MTGHLLTSSTQSAPAHRTVFDPLKPTSEDTTTKVKPKREDASNEDGSIVCVCGFPVDLGLTLECGKCNTWQHGTCYYPELSRDEANREDFEHSCIQCEPRELDRQGARRRIEEMRRLDEAEKAIEARKKQDGQELESSRHAIGASHDKKSKKLPPKTHKKKAKPTDLQLNGHVGTDTSKHGSPHDHPPAKKVKTSHKSSPSISTQSRKRSPSHTHSAPKTNQHGHPLSPATTPPDQTLDFDHHPYPPQFPALHEASRDAELVDTNTLAGLPVTDCMAEWARPESDRFYKDTEWNFEDAVHTESPAPLDPPLRVDTQEYPVGSMIPALPRLKTSSAVHKGVPMIELNGVVGLQVDYCNNPNNGFSTSFPAPLPFVFFPEYIPLYIDARQFGSNARHVRRSCRRNARLDTYKSKEDGWRFWLVSDRQIDANEEITLGWDFVLSPPHGPRMKRLLGLSDDDPNKQSVADIVADINQSDFDALSPIMKALIATYGACACNLGDECAFVQFHRQCSDKLQSRPNAQRRKRARSKPHTISPTSTGQATNSRAASEGHPDDVPDNVSTAGSSRSKAPSRERTPARLGSFDTIGILTEPTNRDKRKVQIAEDLFHKSAQEVHQPPRKKKKSTADGTTGSSATKSKGRNSVSSATEKTNGVNQRRYGDAGASGSKGTSPSAESQISANSPTSAALRQRQSSVVSASRLSTSSTSSNYRDNSVQTSSKLVGGATWQLVQPADQHPEPSPDPSPTSRPQRRVVSLTMRLMNQKRRDSLLAQQRSASAMELDSPATTKSSHGSPASLHKQIPLSSPASVHADTPMPDAPPPAVSLGETSPLLTNGTGPAASPVKIKSPELRVHMPSVPIFTSPPSATVVTTPMSANGSALPSPFLCTNIPSPFAPVAVNGVAATPSPIKKKMSLSEYKNKANKAAASAKPLADASHPLKTAASLADTVKPTVNGDHEAKDIAKSPVDSNSRETNDTALPAA